MSEKVLVTGATGKVGTEVVQGLVAHGCEVKAGTRHPARARELFDPSVEVVELDYDRAETYDAAVQWADRLLLTPPPFDPNAYETVSAFLDWAVASGTRHVTLLSAMGVDRRADLALRRVERQLEEVGVEHTILRPNLFMQNFAPGFLADEIRRDGTVSLPAGDAEVSFVDTRDVASVAIQALTGEKHFARTHTLTGPESLTLDQAAGIIAETLGKPVTYRPIQEPEMREFLEERGWSEGRIETALGLFRSVRNGLRAPVTDAVSRILQRDATPFGSYARDHVDHWR